MDTHGLLTRGPGPTCARTAAGVLELFYTQVSEGTRALSSAIQLLTTAVRCEPRRGILPTLLRAPCPLQLALH